MGDAFHNTYEDALRAAAYAGLKYPGTYYLAFRDLPQILKACMHFGTNGPSDRSGSHILWPLDGRKLLR